MPHLSATEGDPEVIAEVARLRDLNVDDAFRAPVALGECIVVAHAVVLRRRGQSVAVSIDDAGGRRLAAGENLQNIATVTIAQLAIGLRKINTKAEPRTLWTKLSRTSRLPDLAATRLLDLLP